MITAEYYPDIATAIKKHGTPGMRTSSCLLITPEIHNGLAYTRRAIIHMALVFFDPVKIKQQTATPIT